MLILQDFVSITSVGYSLGWNPRLRNESTA
jgi:hypothetical protein